VSISGLSTSPISNDAEFCSTNGSKEADAVQSSSQNDTSSILTKDVDLRQKAAEERYSEQMAELEKAEEDLRLKEELYKHEDEAMLEKLTAQNSFIEKLDVQKVQLICFIEAQQHAVPAGFETSLSTSLFRSEGNLNEVSDGWQEQMYPSVPRAVSSATGRLLTTSRRRSLEDNSPVNGTACPDSTDFTSQPAGFKSKQHCRGMLAQTGKVDQKAAPAQRTVTESPSDLCLLPELSLPWRLLSDDVHIKSRSASAPLLSEEASTSPLSDETRSILLRRLARSPSPRTGQLSSLSLVSVPESIHEEREESPFSGRLSFSEVDIRRHQFASSINRNRWSLDEAHLSGENTAASFRCLAGSNQDVVITDSGLPSSPEAGRLDSSVSCDMNTAMKQKEKASKQSDESKSLGKPRPSILQKIGATLTSLTRRQDTKLASVNKQTPILSLQSKNSHQQSDTGIACNSHSKYAGKAKVQANASFGKKATTDQSKSKSKQPVIGVSQRHLSTSKSRSPSDSVEKKTKSASSALDKSTVPAKMRESFRSFRKRLKLTAEKGLRRKSDDIPVEIFLPKPKVVKSSKDCHDLCVVEEQMDNAADDSCVSGEVMSWHMSSDVDWRGEWTGVFGVPPLGGNMKSQTMKGCDDDSQFSDDSLNDNKNNNSYYQAPGLHYMGITGPAYDGQCFLPFFQESSENAKCDDGSFSDDSLAEDVSSCSANTSVKELGQKPTAVLLPCNTCSGSPVAAVPCIVSNESVTSDNRQLETSVCGLINQRIVESEEHSALYSGDEAVYKQCGQTGVLAASDLQIVPVLREYATPHTGAFTATHHLSDDNTSTLAAG